MVFAGRFVERFFGFGFWVNVTAGMVGVAVAAADPAVAGVEAAEDWILCRFGIPRVFLTDGILSTVD